MDQGLGLPEIHVGLKGSPGTDDHEQNRDDQQDRRSDPRVQLLLEPRHGPLGGSTPTPQRHVEEDAKGANDERQDHERPGRNRLLLAIEEDDQRIGHGNDAEEIEHHEDQGLHGREIRGERGHDDALGIAIVRRQEDMGGDDTVERERDPEQPHQDLGGTSARLGMPVKPCLPSMITLRIESTPTARSQASRRPHAAIWAAVSLDRRASADASG